ncbi:uncharacterized protein LOC118437259 isoform X2 [Folsomia candida]|uniref:uncharacterized protein LOC118437259 isoform X2 n=1 Tax=Folsomia candida TaxID=158441 RepID=UPI0016050972|nr:uncharacterized protein LOC118437259 isoform X2 [Folsomia candida]
MASLVEEVFQNGLILGNIFSWLDHHDLKTVRFVCRNWERSAGPGFSERSRIRLDMWQGLCPGRERTTFLRINKGPLLMLGTEDRVGDALAGILDSFQHFELSFTTYRHTKLVQAYRHLAELFDHLRRPRGSVTYMDAVTFEKNCNIDGLVPQGALLAVVAAQNAVPEVHMRLNLGGYPEGLHFHATSLDIDCTSLQDNVAEKATILGRFHSLKSIMFTATQGLDYYVGFMVENRDQFANLDQVWVDDCCQLKDIRILSRLGNGLRKLGINVINHPRDEFSLQDVSGLETCLVRHFATLRVLDLSFNMSIIRTWKFVTITFPKLWKLNLAMHTGPNQGHFDNLDRDIFDIGKLVKVKISKQMQQSSGSFTTKPDFGIISHSCPD